MVAHPTPPLPSRNISAGVVVVQRPVCTRRHTCSTAARQRLRVTSECVKLSDARLLDFHTGAPGEVNNRQICMYIQLFWMEICTFTVCSENLPTIKNVCRVTAHIVVHVQAPASQPLARFTASPGTARQSLVMPSGSIPIRLN